MVSPVPLIPQESRTLHSNQLINEDILKKYSKATTFRNVHRKTKTRHFAGFSFYISSLLAGNNSPSTEITTVKITPKIDAFTKSNVPPCIDTST
jgi:hypothetical protein